MLPPSLRLWLLADTWKNNPRNKAVRCGVITVGLFFGLIAMGERFGIPGGVIVAGFILVLLFAFLTLFFACMDVVNYFRGRSRGAG